MALTKVDDRGLNTPIDLLDNEKIRFGTGNDLEIFHSGTGSYLADTGTGPLVLKASEISFTNAAENEHLARFYEDGAAVLYHDGSTRITTTASGATITGGVTTTTASTFVGDVTFDNGTNAGKDITWDESENHLVFADSTMAKFGAGGDLQIYHDGTNSTIKNSTGDLYISDAGGNIYIQAKTNEQSIAAFADGSVHIYHDNVEKFKTVAAGITITGTGGEINTDANGHITCKQALDAATAGGALIGQSNRGNLGRFFIGQASSSADGGYATIETCANGSTSLTERVRVDKAGYVGIGTASPTGFLHLEMNTAAKSIGDHIGVFRISNDSTATNSEANIQIATENSYHIIQFNSWEINGLRFGTRSQKTTGGTTGGGHVYLTTANDQVRLTVASDGTFTGSSSNDISDGRLKENITSISNATATLKQLVGKKFNWIKETNLAQNTRYGFIAQEVKPVLPDLVYQDVGINRVSKAADKQEYGKGEIIDDYSDDFKDDTKSEWSMAVNTGGLIPVLVEAFKELEARITALEA